MQGTHGDILHEGTANGKSATLLTVLRAGLGCTSGIGWMWFSGMQIFWPQTLKASPLSRPDSSVSWLVLIPLIFCWPCVGACFTRGSTRLASLLYHSLHALAFTLLFMMSMQTTGFIPIKLQGELLLGLSSACLGIFGFAAVVSLSPREACLGLIAALGFSCVLVFLATFLNNESQACVMPLFALASWLCNISLISNKSQQAASDLPLFTRQGAKSTARISSQAYLPPLCFLFACYFFQSTFVGISSHHLRTLQTWQGMPLTFWGAAFAYALFCHTTRGAALLIASVGFAIHIPAALLNLSGAGFFVGEGLLAVAIVLAMSIMLHLKNADTIRSARLPWFSLGLLLGMFTLLVNAGFHFGRSLAERIDPSTAMVVTATIAMIAAMCLGRMGFKPLFNQAKLQASRSSAQVAASDAAEPTLAVLTPRERHIAALLCAGLTNQAICVRTELSENTVRTHLKNLYRKTGATTRQSLVQRLNGSGIFKNRDDDMT